ncbi:MAG: 50S ribosomal protein L4 [Candidatus Caldipriscus sp.]|jgi:large subunit ribosomal protein L4
MNAPVYNLQGEKIGEIDLPEEIFNIQPKKHVLWEFVRAYLLNQRRGTHKAKTRGEVIGSRKKIWPQKHTGRARHGDRYAPQFVGGGKAHGPRPRDYYIKLPQKVKNLALKMALSDRAQNGRIYVVESLEMEQPKTKLVANFIKSLNIYGNTLFIPANSNRIFYLSARNIEDVEVLPAGTVNAYFVLWSEHVFMERSAIEVLKGRLLK